MNKPPADSAEFSVFKDVPDIPIVAEQSELDAFWAELHQLTDEYRGQCLWFSPMDYFPTNREAALSTIGHIQRNGDVAAFKRAGKLKSWLLQHSSEKSAG